MFRNGTAARPSAALERDGGPSRPGFVPAAASTGNSRVYPGRSSERTRDLPDSRPDSGDSAAEGGEQRSSRRKRHRPRPAKNPLTVAIRLSSPRVTFLIAWKPGGAPTPPATPTGRFPVGETFARHPSGGVGPLAAMPPSWAFHSCSRVARGRGARRARPVIIPPSTTKPAGHRTSCRVGQAFAGASTSAAPGRRSVRLAGAQNLRNPPAYPVEKGAAPFTLQFTLSVMNRTDRARRAVSHRLFFGQTRDSLAGGKKKLLRVGHLRRGALGKKLHEGLGQPRWRAPPPRSFTTASKRSRTGRWGSAGFDWSGCRW